MRSNVIFQTMELHIILNRGVISNMPLHGRSHKECYLRQSGEFLPSANEDKHSREHIVWFFFFHADAQCLHCYPNADKSFSIPTTQEQAVTGGLTHGCGAKTRA